MRDSWTHQRRLRRIPCLRVFPRPADRYGRCAQRGVGGFDGKAFGDRSRKLLPSPGLKDARCWIMCSHFVLTLAARRGSNFNVRRDLNSV
jgi:hypothetical protein